MRSSQRNKEIKEIIELLQAAIKEKNDPKAWVIIGSADYNMRDLLQIWREGT